MLLVRVGPQRPPTLPAGSSGISLRIPPQFRYYPAIGKARGMPARTGFVRALPGSLDPHKPAEKMELTGDSEFRFLPARNVDLSHAGQSATRGSHAETQDLSLGPGAWRDEQPCLVLRLTHNEIAP